MLVVGYSDRFTVAHGETIRFMVSCEQPRYEAKVVRLRHGDLHPEGPGFKAEETASSVDGSLGRPSWTRR